MVELPQLGLLHRQRTVPDVAVPFFFIDSVQTGHQGQLVVTGKVNQPAATTFCCKTVD